LLGLDTSYAHVELTSQLGASGVLFVFRTRYQRSQVIARSLILGAKTALSQLEEVSVEDMVFAVDTAEEYSLLAAFRS
jgi:hypothetical protein